MSEDEMYWKTQMANFLSIASFVISFGLVIFIKSSNDKNLCIMFALYFILMSIFLQVRIISWRLIGVDNEEKKES